MKEKTLRAEKKSSGLLETEAKRASREEGKGGPKGKTSANAQKKREIKIKQWPYGKSRWGWWQMPPAHFRDRGVYWEQQ